jgi:hypothetical protein
MPFAIFEFRISQAQAFCRSVSQLPREELMKFSLKCAELYTNSFTNGTSITNQQILNQFVLANKIPSNIYITEGLVNVDFSNSEHADAAIQWMDFSEWGQGWKLESQTLRGRLILYQPAQK